ncbi:hypothetical protein OG920_46145 [Streptomyces europaeiscabiei]|uniref:hypothetical protein n=1 Tax=Streptomyces TaxID=1883 RepID=UPI000A3A1604|nr:MULTISPECIES: hypothetical protein [Streptomyces]MDX3588941.1 hypothetical protein [Streptomyces europaeiscabiei]MDX3615949.1 hypothetical protein [Streptomyces europaeiscabiei]MDX3637403.1 hypothetical protein [Streptomyces europaeiscabiei]MDX3652982.1 hypothetical protein [Streptomyces europaeiscabiei]
MPESMEGVSPEDWELLVAHEYTYRAALDGARRHVETELDRPREQDLSHLSITIVASLVFGVIAVALSVIGFGWWSLLPVALLAPAFALALHFARRVLRPGPEGRGRGTSGSGAPR